MGLDCPAQDPAEIFWRKLYSQVLEMTVRHIQLILTEPECQTLEKRADFFLIFSWHYSVGNKIVEPLFAGKSKHPKRSEFAPLHKF